MNGQMSLFDFMDAPKEKAQTTIFDLANKAESKPKETPKDAKREVINKAIEEARKPSKPDNVIQFPLPKPDVKPIKTEGTATYDDCKKKLAKYLLKFKDADSQYVLKGLLKLCEVDQNFRNRIVLKDKNYEKALSYTRKKALDGIGAYKFEHTAMMDRDTALGICIDYFNEKE